MKKELFVDVRKHLPALARHEGVADFLERLLGITTARRLFAEASLEDDPFSAVAKKLNLRIEIQGLIERLPKTGPVVLVSNHAFGGADALALTAEVRKLRPDLRMLANEEVALLEGVSETVIGVSLLQKGSAAGQNMPALRMMMKHVRNGGCLGVFPAGRVAFWQDGAHREVKWNGHIVKLIQRMEATVVPVWFFGRPAPWVQILSKISPMVRTAVIARGLTSMRNTTLLARAGEGFSTEVVRTAGEDGEGVIQAKLHALRESGN